MFWYRLEQSLGRNSIVGTTVNRPEALPKHLCVDEKHTRLGGEKTCVATTVGDQCILGVSVAPDAGEEALTSAYGVFKAEALKNAGLWETRNHDPRPEPAYHIPEPIYDDACSQLPPGACWLQ